MKDSDGSVSNKWPKTKLAAVAIVVALVVAPIAAIAGRVQSDSSTGRAISAIVGSGIMRTLHGGFRPNDTVNRGLLALSLQRGLGRMTYVSLGSSVGTGASGVIGSAKIKIDGEPGKHQGVLVHVEGQLDHDNALGSGCFPSIQVTRNASSTVLASRTQELYSGGTGLELPVSMDFLLTDTTNLSPTYKVTLVNPCDSTLFIDGGALTVQTIPLAGTGKAPTAVATTSTGLRPHDRRSQT